MNSSHEALTAIRLTVEAAAPLNNHGQPRWIRVGSALLWICALDEQFVSEPSYKSRRSKDADGRVIEGLRFARNRVAHGGDIVVADGGLEYPLFGGPGGTMEFGPQTWMRAERMRTVGKDQGPASERAAYDAHVAGRLVSDPLNDALRWFERMEQNAWLAPKPGTAGHGEASP